MKIIIVAAIASVAASVATTATVLSLTDSRDDALNGAGVATVDETRTASPTASPADAATLAPVADVQLVESLEALTRRLDAFEMRLASLDRTPVEVPLEGVETDVAAALAANPEATELILGVLESEKAREEAEREQRQAERNEERLRGQAERIAEAVGLSSTEQDKLVTVMMKESDQRNALRDDLRNGVFDGNRESIRGEFQAISEWKYTELGKELGADLSTRIQEYESENRQNAFGRGGTDGGRGQRGGGQRGG